MSELTSKKLLDNLHHHERHGENDPWLQDMCGDAAAEIERLQRELSGFKPMTGEELRAHAVTATREPPHCSSCSCGMPAHEPPRANIPLNTAIEYLTDWLDLSDSISARLEKNNNWSDADRHQHKVDIDERAVLKEQVRCFLADYSAATKCEGQS